MGSICGTGLDWLPPKISSFHLRLSCPCGWKPEPRIGTWGAPSAPSSCFPVGQRRLVALCMGRAGRTWSARWTSGSWPVRGSPAAVHVQVPGGLVCGSDHITYQNICTFQEAVCETEEQNLSFTNDGPCQAVPQIKHCLQHQMIVLGHDVIFICEIFAYPMALMEQKRDKEEFALLGDDPHISVQSRGGSLKYQLSSWLQIEGVRKEDGGTYLCITHNKLLIATVQVAFVPVRSVPGEEPTASEEEKNYCNYY
uniref:Kazal-like domain-containing protein n=1 Tax=Pelusios castaneus TaxID=367368 RepID=A0A8C8RZU6_9SAUR